MPTGLAASCRSDFEARPSGHRSRRYHCTFGLTGDEGGRVGIAARPTRSEHRDSTGQHGSHRSGGADLVGEGALAVQGAPLPSPRVILKSGTDDHSEIVAVTGSFLPMHWG